MDNENKGSDLYKISDNLIGVNPLKVQKLLASEIIEFIRNIEEERSLPIAINKQFNDLKFHVLDQTTIFEISDD